MANYESALTGQQMDAALMDVALRNSEAWAVGTRNGVNVTSADETYHNNAKYYAQVAQSAIPGTYTAAVRWDIAQGLAGEAQEQARANISAGASNRNLLDNPWFTVNQRNFTTSTGVNNFYSVDRWYIARGTGTISKTSNGITINGVGASRETTFQQMIDCGDLTGRTVTLSVNDGGTIRQMAGEVPARTTSNNIFIRFTLRDGVSAFLYAMATSSAYAYMLQFQVNAGYTIDIRAVKLELGSYSTLANDVPPDYETEKKKCMAYFQRISLATSFTSVIGFGVMQNAATNVRINIPTSVPFREGATLSASAGTIGQILIVGNGQSLTATAVTARSAVKTGGVLVDVTVNGNATANQMYAMQFYTYSAYIDISADL